MDADAIQVLVLGGGVAGLYVPGDVSDTRLIADVSVCCCYVQVGLPCRRD